MEQGKDDGIEMACRGNEWLKFKLDGQAYAVSVLQVKEILGGCEITPVPGAAQFVLGIINLRGNIVSVADARRRLGLPESENGGIGWVLILDLDSVLVGLVVDEVSEVVTFEDGEIQRMHEGQDSSLHGVVELDGEMLILLDAVEIAGLERSGRELASAAA